MITILLEKILAALTTLLSNIKTKLTTIKNNLDDLIVVKTASGSIATFETDIEKPLISCNIEIKPKQASGTPSPSNPLPISGTDTITVTQTGANLWDEEWEVGSLTASGADYASTSRIRSKGYIPIAGGVTCYMKSSSIADIHFYDVNKDHISYLQRSNNTFDVPANTKYIRFCLATDYGTTYGNDISINYPSTDTTYHAHVTATTKTVSLPSTVYGGEVDVIGGSGTNKRWYKKVKWSEGTNVVSLGDYTRKIFNFETTGYNVYPQTAAYPQLCNVAEYLANFNTDSLHFYANANSIILFLPNDTDGDTEIEVTGELATPESITLANPITITALDGVNNVFGDTNGNITVQYLKKYKEV